MKIVKFAVSGTFTIKESSLSITTKPIPYDATQEEMRKFVDEARALYAELERDVIESAVEHRTAELELIDGKGINGGAITAFWQALDKLRDNVDKLIAAQKGDYEVKD